ncbi:MAG: hypothetical protein H0U46_05290 [Actinobacteria bacterium]|nr:hypothetical protein [Actinomycetota bacterium]
MHESFARRFRGPLTSANGGYACGRLATYIRSDAVEVTLRLPPPLERPLEVRVEGDVALLLDGDGVVAEARPVVLDLEPPDPVSVEAAEAARERQPREWEPEFRECFVCGERPEGDGLSLHVGPVAGRDPLYAAPWQVGESAPEIVWAAIDCPGAYASGAEGRGTLVLGRMTARVARVPEVGETCVVASWPLGEDGRKLFAGTALFAESGEVLALAKQIWIEPR